MKRVFVEGYKARFDLPVAETTPWYDVWEYVAQENLTLIGAQLTCDIDSIEEVDGYGLVCARVTINGVSAIVHGAMLEYFKSVVAAAENHHFENLRATVMFPAGHGITLREGESVQLNAEKVNTRLSGSSTQTLLGLVLYLVKGL
ncbi:hypothetical protein ES705_44977 [subsurface metagenome]